MRMRRCWACGRRRPFRKTTWKPSEPALCTGWTCIAGLHQSEAHICRLILGDHFQHERKDWRKRLARHRELASRRVSLHDVRT